MSTKLFTSILLVGVTFFYASSGTADDFQEVRDYVKINATSKSFYSEKCESTSSGARKTACRLTERPDFGFIVCKQPLVEGVSCENYLEQELRRLQELDRNHIIVAEFSSDLQADAKGAIVRNVQCAVENTTTCSGFVQHWLEGHFSLDDGIVPTRDKICETPDILKKYLNARLYKDKEPEPFYGKLRELMGKFDKEAARATLAYNFLAIARFNNTKQTFIEDLQGFFDHGDDGAFFAVNDPNRLIIMPKDNPFLKCQENFTSALGQLIQDGPLKK